MNIALIAHDNKKKLMENICVAYRYILNKHTLFATGTTGRMIEETSGLTVHKYLAGHLGGESQLKTQLRHNEIDLMIFMNDPATKQSDGEFMNLVRLCDMQNVPMASNLATAEVLLLALERGDLNWRMIKK